MANNRQTVNPCAQIAIGATDPRSLPLSAPADARWVGSKVMLKADVLEKMAKTVVPKGPMSIPRNFHASSGDLPTSLVLYSQPAPDKEYVVTKASMREPQALYDTFYWRRNKAVFPSFVLALTLVAVPEKGLDAGLVCEDPLTLTVPVDCVEFLSWGKEGSPDLIPGKDFAAPALDVLRHTYTKVNHAFEGYSNRPTGILGVTLEQDERMQNALKGIIRKDGTISDAGLRQLVLRERWERKFVPQEAYYTSGFPETSEFATKVNYAEIADYFTKKFAEEAAFSA